jgi:2-oxo-4-hydroxy-4-carboxy-5-ureidoimidazoline decarboxylase
MRRADPSRRQLCLGIASGLAGYALPLRAQARLTLDDVNRMNEDAFVKAFSNVYELSPWVARAAFTKRPFATVSAFHQAFSGSFVAAPRAQQVKFLHDLSDIGDKQAKAGSVTDASRSEQDASGIDNLEPTDQALLDALNKGYRARFDMSFEICVRRNTVATIFDEYARRLNNNGPDVELGIAIQELFYITRLRVAEMVTGSGAPRIYGDVSAHVLDGTLGKPAEGVAVELHEIWGERSRKVGAATTNADGRATLMERRPVPIGRYELRFAIGDYFRKRGVVPAGEKPFLDVIPMRTYIREAEDNYHYPLVVSPFAYSIHG